MPPRARIRAPAQLRPPPRARPTAPPAASPSFDPASVRARFLPFAPSPGMSWNAALESYARLKRPDKELQHGVWLAHNDQTLTIFDGFEKAKYHMLVLPRDPFPLPDPPGGTVPRSALVSLSALLDSPHALSVLKALRTAGEEVAEMIRDEMDKEEGWTWDVRMGFHAVESMRHVHLHVISSDMISPKLKNKKHWNSFHPTLGFFLHLDDVIKGVEREDGYQLDAPRAYEPLLKGPLISHYPPYAEFKNLPQLKTHLEDEWGRMGRRAREEKQADG